jgi:hypothetical protein
MQPPRIQPLVWLDGTQSPTRIASLLGFYRGLAQLTRSSDLSLSSSPSVFQPQSFVLNTPPWCCDECKMVLSVRVVILSLLLRAYAHTINAAPQITAFELARRQAAANFIGYTKSGDLCRLPRPWPAFKRRPNLRGLDQIFTCPNPLQTFVSSSTFWACAPSVTSYGIATACIAPSTLVVSGGVSFQW